MNATKITKLLTIDGVGKDVVFDGFDFTEDGFVKVLNAGSVTFRNCRVYGLNVSGAAKNYWLRVDSSDPVKIVVEHCFFGDNPTVEDCKLYNLIEPHAVMKDGSGVCENYFTKDVCTHNTVNVYAAEENAGIAINDNVFEMSAGTIRIGVQGEPVCVIDIDRNKVLANNPAYADEDQGLVTVQPYAKKTSTFANMTVNMNGNVCPADQLIYGYSGKNDTVLTADNMPSIYINGEKIEAPIYHQ